ncbi:MAG TPA: hypothetical protein VFT88_12250 [Acidobacteriaceae bacterium]|nr:hypothetical protein [Acidobacteriaceae bacterium]
MGTVRLKSFSKIGAIASFILIPIDCILTIGMLASYGNHWPSYWGWAFITAAFVLDIPALLISIIAPKTGAYFLLSNAIVSLVIAALHLSTGSHSLLSNLLHDPWFAVLNCGLIWGLKILFIWLLLRDRRSGTVDPVLAEQAQR